MANVLAKKKRKYNIKNENFVSHVISCIQGVTDFEKRQFLDEYERNSIRNPAQWATNAPLEEIMVILTKLQFPTSFQMVDARNPLRAVNLQKETKELFRRKDFNKLIELSKKHKYFCFTGREIMKAQSMYAIIANGTLYRATKDSTRLLKSEAYNDIRNQKEVDTMILNILQSKKFNELSLTDIHILFFIRRYDNMPVGIMTIHNGLEEIYNHLVVQKHLAKLYRYGYVGKAGNKQNVMFALAAKAWQFLDSLKREEYFRGIRFWEQAEPINLQYATGSIERGSEGKSKD